MPLKQINRGATQKRISFGGLMVGFFKKYFQFSGVATRLEFWWTLLFLMLCFCVFVVITSTITIIVINSMSLDAFEMMGIMLLCSFVPMLLVYMLTIVPFYSLMARRFHDAGVSAKWLWLSAVPQVISLVMFCVFVLSPRGAVWFPQVLGWLSATGSVLLLVWLVVCALPSKTKNNPYRD